MTRRSSPRAQVRALFCEMNGQGGAFEGATPTNFEATADSGSGRWIAGSSPAVTTDRQTGDASIAAAENSEGAARRHTNTSAFTSAQATQATERARALYEDTAVPVREIARRCGVTEHTIYRYARRLNWKPRYHWVAGEAGVRHRRWQPAEKFAPAKGAGARFIRREAAGKPFAAGLKALDPQAEALAAADCDAALKLARVAEMRAAQSRRDEQVIAAIGAVGDALAEILAWRRTREKAAERAAREEFRAATDVDGFVWRDGIPYIARLRAAHEQRQRATALPLPPDRFEEAMWHVVAAALARWEAAQREVKFKSEVI